MAVFEVVDGRMSEHYDHFSEYTFSTCQAIATRLMGVVALKVTWKNRAKSRVRYIQIMHLDYSEYGFDEYREFELIPGDEHYADNKKEMNSLWEHFIGVMGGQVVEISADAMLKLIELAEPLASDDIDREYDTPENRDFRADTLMRLEMMKAELEREGITSDTCTTNAAIYASSPRRLATCETINYFIMRMVDCDFDAAAYLSTIDKDELKRCPLCDAGVQTLMKSKIKRSRADVDPPADGISYPYRVTITTLGRSGYYHASFVIYLDGDYRSRDPKVTQIDIGSVIKLSEIESALQITNKEFITVFSCPDEILNGFNGNLIPPLHGVDPVAVPNGWLYTIYKRDNSHVNRAEYRMGDDVFGYALLTIGGEFILMSNDVNSITTLDNATLFSPYSLHMRVKGRFLLEKTPVFHTICHSHGAYFEDLIEMPPES